jgi:hypothetical protein
MPLYALTEADEIAQAYEQFAARLRDGAEQFTRHVGWQGGGGEYPIYWHPQLPLWSLNEANPDHYWFGFGNNDPNGKGFGSIAAQISFHHEGKGRQRSGVFARDNSNGTIHVAHSGNVGGGKAGVGKNAFLDYYVSRPNSRFQNVHWKSGSAKGEYIPLGALDDADLLTRIAAFVREVARFKAGTVSA